ncbi:MAG: hypothetical protein NVV82_19400 [Sporocytophaga sp.]|nr:hypothetical protein [Sporocytophaga sp.]
MPANLNQSGEEFGIVQADRNSVLVNLSIIPIYYEYLCYKFIEGTKLKGYLKLEANIYVGSGAIAPEIGHGIVTRIDNGLAYFEPENISCDIRKLIPLTQPTLVFIPNILM